MHRFANLRRGFRIGFFGYDVPDPFSMIVYDMDAPFYHGRHESLNAMKDGKAPWQTSRE